MILTFSDADLVGSVVRCCELSVDGGVGVTNVCNHLVVFYSFTGIEGRSS